SNRSNFVLDCRIGLACACRGFRPGTESSADLIHFSHEDLPLPCGRLCRSSFRHSFRRFSRRDFQSALVCNLVEKGQPHFFFGESSSTRSSLSIQDRLRWKKLCCTCGRAWQRSSKRASDFSQTTQFTYWSR